MYHNRDVNRLHENEDLIVTKGTAVGVDASGTRIEKKSAMLWLSLAGIAVLMLGACGLTVGRVGVRAGAGAGAGAGGPTPGRAGAGPSAVVACYYGTPRARRDLQPRDIHPHLCTHINVAFASVHDKQVRLDDHLYRTLREIVKLKRVNPELKILLSIGGAGGDGFSEMVADHASRKIFIKSVKNILRNYTLDGIDLDWEFPAVHGDSGIGKRERQHFSQLLREIRAEYVRERRNYLLTAAVGSPETIVDVAYDVDQLNLYLDFVNIMTYDFHYFTKFTPFTGLNSPLYARHDEQLYLASLNINYTVQMYKDKGLQSDKIVVGIPTYGHTFSLVNSDNTGVGSPASGFGSLGDSGFINYPDVCMFLKNFSDTTVKQDADAKVPYLYRAHEWVSFDTPQSVMDKATFIKDHNLRGAMIYSLNADDYEGVCEGQLGNKVKFPLSQSVKNTLIDKNTLKDSNQ